MTRAIRFDGLSKRYVLRHEQNAYLNFRDVITNTVKSVFTRKGRATREEFWALKDVSFEVQEGERLGIIGRNGAGKSTLLKLLSRITEPTHGRIQIRGRVASLLEVGTGFHPELTGRENIFLNGAILGMSKLEIRRKFDEIVDFAEVERFLDTPVKRYSSGMYVRLAFAVAAHLDPDVLVVDEVLAVGDIAFQKKCLGKMKDVATSRTVLFVSHNLGAIEQLCDRAIWLRDGTLQMDGPAATVLEAYTAMEHQTLAERVWDRETAPSFDDKSVRLASIRVTDPAGEPRATFDVKEPVTVKVGYWVTEARYALNVHVYFKNTSNQTLFVAMDDKLTDVQQPGRYEATVTVPPNLFNEGVVQIEYLICCRPHTGKHVTVPQAVTFEMTDDRAANGARGDWAAPWPPSAVRPMFAWNVTRVDEP
jgi:lipopolysaccharide transport system ATP-binding protein